MKSYQRAGYLRALGVEVWVPKVALASSPSRATLEQVDPGSSAGNEAAPFSAASNFFVEPGTSDTLLLCGSQAEARMIIALDISRSLKAEPLWGWAVSEGTAGGSSLEEAIRDRLITRLIVFGKDICGRGLAGPEGDGKAGVIGTAEVLRVASLPALAISAQARRALWEALNLRQWCAARARRFSLNPDGEIEG